MEKHASVFRVPKEEVEGLVSKLKESGFLVVNGLSRMIYSNKTIKGKVVGYLEPHFHDNLFYVLEGVGEDSLKYFIENEYPSLAEKH